MAVFVVVRATLRLPGQLAIQVGRNQCFDRLVRRPGHHVDALLSEDRQGSLANAEQLGAAAALTNKPPAAPLGADLEAYAVLP